MDHQTDIFQLGLLLWLLAEQKPNHGVSFCRNFGCTKRPMYTCGADHANPVGLPPCPSFTNIPTYFTGIIDRCRSADPKDRPPAHELLGYFPCWDDPKAEQPGLKELLIRYSKLGDEIIGWCDECCAALTDEYYHCNICRMANFDICQTCYAEGVRYLDPNHHLSIRVIGAGDISNP